MRNNDKLNEHNKELKHCSRSADDDTSRAVAVLAP